MTMDLKEAELLCHVRGKLSQCTLYTLPPELFVVICSYLDAKFILDTLSQVCQKFKEIIEDESLWKSRVLKKWPDHFIHTQGGDGGLCWKDVCVAKEEQIRLWSSWPQLTRMYTIQDAHDAAVDKIHIFQAGRLCASGSRDRNVKVWHLERLKGLQPTSSDLTECLVHCIPNAHNGWIWSLTSDADTLYSGAWDGCIRFWDMKTNFAQTSVLNCLFGSSSPTAVLCLAVNGDLVCAGTYAKRVYLFDRRSLDQPAMKLSCHKKPVLCLSLSDKYIISGSEDETLVIYNLAAGKKQAVLKFDDYPMCMSHGLNQIWLGDKQGRIHLVDPTQQRFSVVKSFNSLHCSRITGILHSYGSIITSSTDKYVHVMEPSLTPRTIASFCSNSEVSGISQYKTILASSKSDGTVSIWIPSDWEFNGEV